MRDTPNMDEVICPSCNHQFRAIPQNVQEELAAERSKIDLLDCTAREGGYTRHCRIETPCLKCRHDDALATLPAGHVVVSLDWLESIVEGCEQLGLRGGCLPELVKMLSTSKVPK